MTKQQTIERIAREILDLQTLQTRRMDSLDFKEQSVWSIAKALDAAYEAGRVAGRPRRRNDEPGFRIGQRVRVKPLGEAGRITGTKDDDHILIVEIDTGGTVHVPTADCKPIARRQRP